MLHGSSRINLLSAAQVERYHPKLKSNFCTNIYCLYKLYYETYCSCSSHWILSILNVTLVQIGYKFLRRYKLVMNFLLIVHAYLCYVDTLHWSIDTFMIRIMKATFNFPFILSVCFIERRCLLHVSQKFCVINEDINIITNRYF